MNSLLQKIPMEWIRNTWIFFVPVVLAYLAYLLARKMKMVASLSFWAIAFLIGYILWRWGGEALFKYISKGRPLQFIE